LNLGSSITESAIAALLAQALEARGIGDFESEANALQRVLELQPEHLAASLLRADNSARLGDRRAAVAFYQSALAIARRRGAPPNLRESLELASRYLQESMRLYRQSLDQALAHHEHAGLRFQHAVDMLNGDRRIYLQEPSALYVPYLPQRQFFERCEFSWTPRLETKTDAIRGELQGLLDSAAEFRPYVEPQSDRPARDFFGLQGDPSWSAFYLYRNGEMVAENAARCPNTMTALADVPLSRVGERTPSVFFSLLRPGAHIPPHRGMLNCRLICHLPLIVPGGCWFRVGNETREWETGELVIFDDSIEHEAKNQSDQIRVVLIFDIWRPELSEAETAGISAIFETIDAFTSLRME
jgi:aspartyl/asparaginyl beta-hydroxylase